MGLKVLSLCDGLSCGQMAFEKANIEVSTYYASEIKQIAIDATKRISPKQYKLEMLQRYLTATAYFTRKMEISKNNLI